jgi:hypothetical protein
MFRRNCFGGGEVGLALPSGKKQSTYKEETRFQMFENLMKWVSSRAVRATEARVNGMGGPNPCLNLADARQGKGITLEEIARSTKIDLRILQAIEAENFAKLPGGLYGTSFIRQYAQTIGYEESVMLDHYFSKMELEPTDTACTPRPSLDPNWTPMRLSRQHIVG